MNVKTIYLLFLCLIMAISMLAVSYLVTQLIAQRSKRVLLVVAKHDYPKGIAITDPEEMFELQEIFESDAPREIIFDLKHLRGISLTSDIREGQPLQRDFLERNNEAENKVKLDPPAPGRKYLNIITAKSREESIQVGTRVNVFQSKSEGDPKGETIVLRDVLVLAVVPAPSNLQGKLDEGGKTNRNCLACCR